MRHAAPPYPHSLHFSHDTSDCPQGGHPKGHDRGTPCPSLLAPFSLGPSPCPLSRDRRQTSFCFSMERPPAPPRDALTWRVLRCHSQQHNLFAAAHMYNNITFEELGFFLHLPPDQAESIARDMLLENRILGMLPSPQSHTGIASSCSVPCPAFLKLCPWHRPSKLHLERWYHTQLHAHADVSCLVHEKLWDHVWFSCASLLARQAQSIRLKA